jgi:hypothetical protein
MFDTTLKMSGLRCWRIRQRPCERREAGFRTRRVPRASVPAMPARRAYAA